MKPGYTPYALLSGAEMALRENFMDLVTKRAPSVTPRDDFDLFMLGTYPYKGPLSNDNAYPWIDEEYNRLCAYYPEILPDILQLVVKQVTLPREELIGVSILA